MANKQVTIKQAFLMIYDELAGIMLPSNLFLTVGTRIGNAMQIVHDCVESIERDERAAQEAAERAEQEAKNMDGNPDGQDMTHDPGSVIEVSPDDDGVIE